MLVVALAHQDELHARRALERALGRMSATSLIGTPAPRRMKWKRLWRRCIKARVAYRQAFDALAVAQGRHSRWYRAYLRARRGL
jgi:hypothetical protein